MLCDSSDLVKNSADDCDNERATNLGACVAALTMESGPPKGAPKLPETTYELQYNKATALVAQGEYSEALTLLKKSEGKPAEYPFKYSLKYSLLRLFERSTSWSNTKRS